MNYDEHQDHQRSRPHRQPGVVHRQSDARAQGRAQRKAHLRHRQLRLRLDALHSRSQEGQHHPKPQGAQYRRSSVSDTWQRASDADADLDLDYDTLNPHFEYIDEDNNQRHVVWFLDGVTVLNELRAARQLGLQTFALWRLGWEDSSLWNVWDKPSDPDSLQALGSVQPGHDVDTEGEGDIMRVTGLPQPGKRTVKSTPTSPTRARSSSSTSTWMCIRAPTPSSSTATTPMRCALLRRRPRSQVDAEDPRHPEAEERQGHLHADRRRGAENVGLMQRIVREGNEIGNHTYTIPTSAKSRRSQLDLEVKLTERLFASKLGVQPLYFRPPYDIDEEPDTDDQAAPVVRIQQMATPSSAARSTPTTGTSIRANRPQEITAIVLAQLQT
jgi:peptidoglycan-N-acetylglucosamine deacetylase